MKTGTFRTMIILLSAATWAACGNPTVPAAHPGAQTGDSNSPASFAVIGRTLALDSASHLRMSWPGVSLGTQFQGSGVQVNLRDVNNTFNGQVEDSYWNVNIDGNVTAHALHLTTDANTYVLAQGLADGNHTVWVTKSTEAMLGSSEFSGFSLVGAGHFLDAPAVPARHIEVIGSSVETGYGVGSTQCSGYQGINQNQDLAWPQQMANQLQVALMNTSYSGKGLINNISPADDPTNVMPVLYPLADARDFQDNWDFSKQKADAVMIDLGGNDWNGLGASPDAATFTAAYVALIKKVQSNSPGAPVYVLLNATTPDPARADLRTLYKSLVTTLADPTVRFFEFPAYTGTDFACDGHPTPALHATMAQQIATQVKADLGW